MATPGRGSRVVFVGNIPYDMTEEQLISIFSEVGPVVGFRLVFDRESGKPKGYGFCEFHDPETAASAVRNLNDVDVGGRSLRIDWADVDPVFQGRTTQMGMIEGELPKREGRRPGNPGFGGFSKGGGPGAGMGQGPGPGPGPDAMGPGAPPYTYNTSNVPPGVTLPSGMTATDAITNTLSTLPPNQLMDIMSQMKSLILTSPQSANNLLSSHPQLTYALFQAMLMMNLVDPSILQRILAGGGAAAGGQPPANQDSHYQQQSGPYGQQQRGYPGAPPPPPGAAPGPPPTGVPAGPSSSANPYGARPPMPPQVQPQQPYSNTPPHRPAYAVPYGNNGNGGGNVGTPPQYMGGAGPGSTATPPLGAGGAGAGLGGAAAAVGAGGPPSNLPDSQRQLLMQVLSLTDAQIADLPADQRDSIMMLRKQYGK